MKESSEQIKRRLAVTGEDKIKNDTKTLLLVSAEV